MNFQYPWALLFVPLVAVPLIVWTWRRRGRNVVLPFDHSRAGRGNWLRGTVNFALTLPLLLFAVVIVILANPLQLSEPKTRRILTNIEFCVDISGSMTASFGDGSRYDGSMEAINDFLDYREGDAFGLTFFGNSVLHWTPLTSDASAIRCSPPFMRPESVPGWFGGTAIGKALLACREVLAAREEGDRMIILVSDGNSWDIENGNDIELAKKLRGDNIIVYAVHISNSAVPDSIVNITSLTGGEVFEPGDPEGLKIVFQRIDEMQQTRTEKIAAETMDHFAPWCFAGLILVGLITTTQFGLRYTPW